MKGSYTINSQIRINVLALVFLVFAINIPATGGTALGNLAASMSTGTFAELTGMGNWNNGNILLPAISGCSTGDYGTQFASSAVWNPIGKKFQFVGSPHGYCSQYVFVIYDDASNSWSVGPQPYFGYNLKHSYDHNTISVSTGVHYLRDYNSKTVYKLSNGGSSWSTIAPIPMSSNTCCGALEWFPNQGHLIFIDGDWGGWSYNPSSNSWTHLFRTNGNDGSGLPQYPMSGYLNFAEYSKLGFLVFGGGSNIYKMNSAGTITTLASAPFGDVRVGTGSSCCSVTTDPVAGYIVVIDAQRRVWRLDPVAESWTNTGLVAPSTFSAGGGVGESLISAPISDYGVIMYVKCDDSSTCRAYLYKNAAGSATVDTTPPSQVTGLTATAASSTQINLAWNSATDNIGVAGYKIYRGGTQIATATTTSYSDSGLSASTSHSYAVAAYDAAGNAGAQSSSVSATTPPSTVISSGLVGWYKFDEGSGTTASDSSGNGNNGTLINGPTWTTGKIGGALSFDGVNDYIETGKTATQLGINGANPKTVSVWAYTKSFDATINPAIFNFGSSAGTRDFSLRTDGSDNAWRVNFWNEPPDITFTYPSKNVWVHFVVTYDGTTAKVYANGNQIGSRVYALNTGNDRTFSIGRWNAYTSGYFNGYIDDVRVYNRALSAQEILDIYNSAGGIAPTPTPTPPSAPTNLFASAVSSSQINLAWTASTDNVGVTGYKIYRNGNLIGTSSTNSYSDTGLSPLTTYSYTVAAYDAAGNVGEQSSSVNTTTPSASVLTLNHDGPVTPEQISIFIPSSLPTTATASVRYRQVGSSTWITRSLHRIRPDFADSEMTVDDGFAWPIIGLTPGTSYEVEATVTNGAQVTAYASVMTTRALPAPAGAATKTIAAGSTSAQIQSVFDSAVPGDVIQFMDGTYNVDNIRISRSGTNLQPIYIRGQSREGVILQDTTGTVLRFHQASDVVVENMILKGSGVDSGVNAYSRGIDFWDSWIQERITIRDTIITGVDMGIIVFGEAKQILVYNNMLVGNNQWNQDFYPYNGAGTPGSGDGTPDLDQNIFWNDDGIRITGQGNAAFSNTLSGFGDALAMAWGYKSVGVHFYRNEILMTGDDAIEADYGTRNIAFYDNRVHNAMTLVSLDPIWGGPFLAARNIGINIGRGPYKLNNQNTGHFLYSNTVVRTNNPKIQGGWVQFNNGGQRAWGYENNILIYQGNGDLFIMEAWGQDPVDFTHNSWFPNRSVWWSNSGGIFTNLASAYGSLRATTPVFSGSTRRHEADNIAESNPFVTSINLGADYHTQIPTLYTPYLRSGTAPKNSGAVIPGITDGFSGNAPDRGALIEGVPLPVWGVRSAAHTPTPTITFSSTPSSITSGSSSTLSWSSTNANSCTASGGWTGTKATSETQSVSPTSTTTYTLTCSGAGGSGSQSTAITVQTTTGNV